MTDITIADLTNKTSVEAGTGVFDKLMEAMKLHLKDEFDEGRITGPEFATVYLGALQATLQQSLTFLLSEQEASAKIDLIEKQIAEAEERIDLVRAQTAAEYEKIAASKAKTARDNVLNGKQVLKVEQETSLIDKQEDDQVFITTQLRPEEVTKLQEEIDLLESRDLEQIAATTRSDDESTQKIALMAAQTLGFASDTKIKLLKQMQDGFAVALSIAGVGNIPEANQDNAIDDLSNEVLNDLGSLVDITASEIDPPAQ